LAAIAEINRLMYRQATPREVLSATAAQVGKHLGVTRCLIAVGSSSEATQLVAKYVALGGTPAGPGKIATLSKVVSRASPDALAAISLDPAGTPGLGEFGLESALAVVLSDKETQAPAGVLLVGDAGA